MAHDPLNSSLRGEVCRCGKPYMVNVVTKRLSPIDQSVITRDLRVYICEDDGDCWVDNINNEPETQS